MRAQRVGWSFERAGMRLPQAVGAARGVSRAMKGWSKCRRPPSDRRSALGSARLGSARLGSARLGSARLGSARLGSARLGSARLGSARLGSARLGSARLGSARLGSARLGSARLGSARLGSARLGSARLGSARLGSARLGSARLGSARQARCRTRSILSTPWCRRSFPVPGKQYRKSPAGFSALSDGPPRWQSWKEKPGNGLRVMMEPLCIGVVVRSCSGSSDLRVQERFAIATCLVIVGNTF